MENGDAIGGYLAEPPPYNEILGPVRDRGGANGLILRGGRIVAEWGETSRVDMTFSATKSYVATCAGLAYDRGLIPDLNEPVCDRAGGPEFETPRKRLIPLSQVWLA
jgi:CubicO group peptidase (beta-lactamase class C family)